jgi:hypothetical protein
MAILRGGEGGAVYAAMAERMIDRRWRIGWRTLKGDGGGAARNLRSGGNTIRRSPMARCAVEEENPWKRSNSYARMSRR